MKITAVHAELHVFDEKVNYGQPIRFAVSFDDGPLLRLLVSSDGSALLVDQLALEPAMDMGEAGRTETFDVTDRLDRTLRGAQTGEPLAIRNPAGRVIGIALPRRDDQPFCFWVDGDEFCSGPEAALHRHGWLQGSEPFLDGPLST